MGSTDEMETIERLVEVSSLKRVGYKSAERGKRAGVNMNNYDDDDDDDNSKCTDACKI